MINVKILEQNKWKQNKGIKKIHVFIQIKNLNKKLTKVKQNYEIKSKFKGTYARNKQRKEINVKKRNEWKKRTGII